LAEPQAFDTSVVGIGLLRDIPEIYHFFQRLMQVLLRYTHGLQQFVDTAVGIARDEIEQAMMNPGKPELGQALIGLVSHRAKTEVHRFQRQVQFLLSFWHDEFYFNRVDIIGCFVR
jgi:hypothetical protein